MKSDPDSNSAGISEVSLRDNCLVIQYGYTQSASEEKVGPKFLRITDIQDKPISWDTVPYCKISKEDYEKYRLVDGDILIARTGASTGTNAIYLEEMPDAVFASYLIRVRPNSRLLPGFVYYFLQSPVYKKHIASIIGGSAQPNANAQQLTDVFIPLFPIEQQCVIANVLGILGRKTELNCNMNKILETLCWTIFKHWFVDFEFPNEEGKPYKSSGGEMVDSELGEIPRGWALKSIGDVLELAYGKALKDSERHSGVVPVFGSNGQVGWHDEKLVDGPGIIVGRKGNPGVITLSHTPFFPIDTTFYVVSKGLIRSIYYLFHALRAQNLPNLAADSAVPGLNRNIAYMNQMIVPSCEMVKRFDECVNGMYRKVQANNEESRALGAVRDALLPKLMSGQIRVGSDNQTWGAD